MNTEQLCMFDEVTARRLEIPQIQLELQWELEDALRSGSGWEGGKVRIRAALLLWQNDRKKLVEYLKKEYGTGGHSTWFGVVDYGPDGMRIWNRDREGVMHYSWARVALELLDLEKRNAYASVQEMQTLYEIRRRHDWTLPKPEPGRIYK